MRTNVKLIQDEMFLLNITPFFHLLLTFMSLNLQNYVSQ